MDTVQNGVHYGDIVMVKIGSAAAFTKRRSAMMMDALTVVDCESVPQLLDFKICIEFKSRAVDLYVFDKGTIRTLCHALSKAYPDAEISVVALARVLERWCDSRMTSRNSLSDFYENLHRDVLEKYSF